MTLSLTRSTVLVGALALPLFSACGSGPAEAGGAGDAPSTPAETSSADEANDVQVPEAVVVTFDELDDALAARRGEGTLLNFWAMWCAPCVAELPELVEVGHHFADQGGKVVGVSYDLMLAGTDRATVGDAVEAFLAKRGLDFETVIYDDDDYEEIDARFELKGGVPVTLALDAEGNIVDREDGEAGAERFEEMMRAALGL